MQGFGVQTKNINDLIKQIEQEIAFIKKNLDKDIVQLNNKLVNCITDLNNLKQAFNDLKDYTEEEYSRVKGQIQGFEAEIEEIRNNLIQVDYRSVGGETVAVGLAPKKEYEQTRRNTSNLCQVCREGYTRKRYSWLNKLIVSCYY